MSRHLFCENAANEMSPLEHCIALKFYDPRLEDSNPVGDCQGYELFFEITLKNRRFLDEIKLLVDFSIHVLSRVIDTKFVYFKYYFLSCTVPLICWFH